MLLECLFPRAAMILEDTRGTFQVGDTVESTYENEEIRRNKGLGARASNIFP